MKKVRSVVDLLKQKTGDSDRKGCRNFVAET